MSKAKLVIKDRFAFQDGSIGYDNAEGQGYHKHDGDKVESYEFEGIDKLFDDFYKDIWRVREDENKKDKNRDKKP